jgi:hypothetical protein
MELGHVVVSGNDHPKYFRFVPVFSAAWRYFYPNIKLHIIYTGLSPINLNFLHQYFDVVEHLPLKIFKDSVLGAQVSRIYYPALIDSDQFVVTTDIDLIPLSSNYYLNVIQEFDEKSFIVMRNVIAQYKELPIGYNLATSSTWRDVFGVLNHKQFTAKIYSDLRWVRHDGQHGGKGWNHDQRQLWRFVIDRRNKWDADLKRLILLKDDHPGISFKRLDREQKDSLHYFLNTNIEILGSLYKDYHMPELTDNEILQILSKLT